MITLKSKYSLFNEYNVNFEIIFAKLGRKMIENPLIEETAEDTLLNVHTVMLLMQRYCIQQTMSSAEESHINAETAATGMNLVLQCCSSAIGYKLERIEQKTPN